MRKRKIKVGIHYNVIKNYINGKEKNEDWYSYVINRFGKRLEVQGWFLPGSYMFIYAFKHQTP